ncbi:MAG: tRNA (adenosine(37)-N6)-threonylcarbamoyltransferase complex dimerization subunit type 1 TsaB [Oscillospiraceae bacterium]|nr:tRNA (adenosine(37)-N6)-threonylcarbamoyltransferase complex dimerization subunit type 1 TsaB [Oscillospiraceae bacterium]
MRILGIDTSGKTASVAILDTEKKILLGEHSIYTARTHSQVIMPMCKNLLSDCNMTVQDVDGFAVSVGPGSYTGIRIGIAAVQGMAMVNQTPCAGISTLAALASRVGSGNVLALIHAREDLFYYGIYDFASRIIPAGTLADHAEILNILENYAGRMTLTGDGAELFIQNYANKIPDSLEISLTPPALRLQSAAGICTCAEYIGFGTSADLTANYLQAVQIQKRKGEK